MQNQNQTLCPIENASTATTLSACIFLDFFFVVFLHSEREKKSHDTRKWKIKISTKTKERSKKRILPLVISQLFQNVPLVFWKVNGASDFCLRKMTISNNDEVNMQIFFIFSVFIFIFQLNKCSEYRNINRNCNAFLQGEQLRNVPIIIIIFFSFYFLSRTRPEQKQKYLKF